MPNPDFELNDNVGRTSEQTTAARLGIATPNDLKRWARRDAEVFLAEHPLPTEPLPTPDTAPFRAALAAAETPAEVSAVTRHFLHAAQPTLHAVFDFLTTIAQRGDQHLSAGPGSPPELLIRAANCAVAVLGISNEADLGALRAEYDTPPATPTAPTAPTPEPGLPPTTHGHNGRAPGR
ncbi:hypothetical protein [Streptomyces sp. NPDC026589]|uniref:hypothetical protein n=1 Tax=Streptomyces sp. NPDC026589 TaxID=3155609 RepID=UPI00340124B4